MNNIIFLSLTNKIINNPKNVISAGINAISQINAIIKFQELYKIKRSIFLIPNSDFKNEIEEAISKTKIKLKDTFIYDTDPTLLTAQIEKLTRYSQRKQRLKDEIERLENSNEVNKEKKISLVITNSKNTTIASKNSKGEAQTNRIVVNVNVKIILAENNIVVKNFSKSSIYDVIDRKSEQKLIENKLIENLSGEIALQIIFEILKNSK